ncbi:hypothetical protein EDD22DRAFT_850296 [Suillus occidentalis]|nr:hypothetical protein EDD22DRAFT_850296 [Suillus occidentalis]
MKLSFVFSTFASIVVLATAYPTQGPVAKRSRSARENKLQFPHKNIMIGKARQEALTWVSWVTGTVLGSCEPEDLKLGPSWRRAKREETEYDFLYYIMIVERGTKREGKREDKARGNMTGWL